MQELIHNQRAQPLGTQTPFTNLTFDWRCPPTRLITSISAARKCPFSYGELQAEMDMINRAYIEVMIWRRTRPRFTFPSPPTNITRDFPLGSPQR